MFLEHTHTHREVTSFRKYCSKIQNASLSGARSSSPQVNIKYTNAKISSNIHFIHLWEDWQQSYGTKQYRHPPFACLIPSESESDYWIRKIYLHFVCIFHMWATDHTLSSECLWKSEHECAYVSFISMHVIETEICCIHPAK